MGYAVQRQQVLCYEHKPENQSLLSTRQSNTQTSRRSPYIGVTLSEDHNMYTLINILTQNHENNKAVDFFHQLVYHILCEPSVQ